MVSDDRRLDTLHTDLVRLAAIPDHQLAAPVPSCPGWTVADLLAHLGRVHHRAVRILDGASFVPLDAWEPTPEGEAAVAWSREVATELEAALRRVDPAAPADTWLGEAPASFWIRRMAQETSVHRWDADGAFGAPSPIEAAIGADGVDEFLIAFLPRLPADLWEAIVAPDAGPLEGAEAETHTIHLHATDTEGEWMITVGPQGASVSIGHGKGDVAVRAGGAALDLLVWNRLTPDEDGIECFGDRGLLDRFLAVTRL